MYTWGRWEKPGAGAGGQIGTAKLARFARPFAAALSMAALAAACSDSAGPGAGDDPTVPPGPDVTQPYPIDRGDDPGTPGTYKGLWLRLVDNGTPTVTPVDGLIGLVCVSMSNGNQECADFIERVGGAFAHQVNPAVRVVNCAVGGHAIEKWIDPAYDGVLWDDCITRKIPQAGLRPDQVRVLWHKAANQFTTVAGGAAKPAYPDASSDYAAFLGNLGEFASRVPTKFPSVRAVYTSSRSYGGFAGNPGRGEPLSYEEGHALNSWLREHRDVQGVWYGWGPYLWAPDCATGVSNGGGVCFVREDYVADGVHPSESAKAKVSALLHARFRQESWYRR